MNSRRRVLPSLLAVAVLTGLIAPSAASRQVESIPDGGWKGNISASAFYSFPNPEGSRRPILALTQGLGSMLFDVTGGVITGQWDLPGQVVVIPPPDSPFRDPTVTFVITASGPLRGAGSTPVIKGSGTLSGPVMNPIAFELPERVLPITRIGCTMVTGTWAFEPEAFAAAAAAGGSVRFSGGWYAVRTGDLDPLEEGAPLVRAVTDLTNLLTVALSTGTIANPAELQRIVGEAERAQTTLETTGACLRRQILSPLAPLVAPLIEALAKREHVFLDAPSLRAVIDLAIRVGVIPTADPAIEEGLVAALGDALSDSIGAGRTEEALDVAMAALALGYPALAAEAFVACGSACGG